MVEKLPKGEMCIECVHKKRDCSGLDFSTMKVIAKFPDYHLVKCTDYEKEKEEMIMDGKRYTLNDYQGDALRFRMESANEQYALLGLPGEAGEVASLAAKAIRDGKTHEYEHKMKKELGDVMWFIAAIAADNGYTLQDVADANILKLSGRKLAGTISGSGDDR